MCLILEFKDEVGEETMASLSLDSPEEVSGNSNLTLSTQSVVTSMCMKIWQRVLDR